MSKQKNKGSAWEREVAKDLSERYNTSFIRTPSSGAMIGGFNLHRKNSLSTAQSNFYKGDVSSDQFPTLNIECKNYKEFLFHQLLSQDCPVLDKWIEQCIHVADEGDINIIIFKITRKGKYICIENNQSLDYAYGYKYKDFVVYEYGNFFKNNSLEIYRQR